MQERVGDIQSTTFKRNRNNGYHVQSNDHAKICAQNPKNKIIKPHPILGTQTQSEFVHCLYS